MKNLILIMSLLVISCKGQENDIKIIDGFIQNIVLQDSTISNMDTLNTYLDTNNSHLKSEKEKFFLSTYIKAEIKSLKTKIIESDSNYKVYAHNELIENHIKFNYKYKKLSKVYHLVDNNMEVITSFVIENNKIKSFTYGIVKTKTQPYGPWLLNE